LEKTNAKVYFSIFGDNFPIDTITNSLNLEPTHSHKKGEIINRKTNPIVKSSSVLYRKDTAWQIGTEYEETLDLEEQIIKVIKQLENKEEVITDLCRRFNLECYFMIVIVINEGHTPAISINKEFIRLANSIGAEIHFDTYANPYQSSFDE